MSGDAIRTAYWRWADHSSWVRISSDEEGEGLQQPTSRHHFESGDKGGDVAVCLSRPRPSRYPTRLGGRLSAVTRWRDANR
jgi:hypothetical protein